MALSRLADRLPELEASLQSDPSPRNVMLVADACRLAGRPERAAELLAGLVGRNESAIAPRVLLAWALDATGRPDEAADVRAEVRALDPANPFGRAPAREGAEGAGEAAATEAVTEEIPTVRAEAVTEEMAAPEPAEEPELEIERTSEPEPLEPEPADPELEIERAGEPAPEPEMERAGESGLELEIERAGGTEEQTAAPEPSADAGLELEIERTSEPDVEPGAGSAPARPADGDDWMAATPRPEEPGAAAPDEEDAAGTAEAIRGFEVEEAGEPAEPPATPTADPEQEAEPERALTPEELADIPPSPLYSATLAEIFERQGFEEKAIEIYEEVVRTHPERVDLRERIAEIERRLPAGPPR
jgi:hypothetical protein